MTRNLLKRIQLLAVMFTLAVPFAGIAHAQEWKNLSFPKDGFRVSSPVPLEANSDMVDTDSGKMALSGYSGDFNSASLVITVCDCAAKFGPGDSDQILEKAQLDTLNLAHAHVVHKKKVMQNGHPGLEVESQNDSRHFFVRSFVVGNQLYAIIVAFPSGAMNSFDTARRFIDSFEFLRASR